MKKIYTSIITLLCLVGSFSVAFGQVTTIDFETAGSGYTPSGTSGSGFTDVFNRSNPDIGGNSTYIWSVEDNPLSNPSIDLDQIDITGSSAFDFDIDMVTHHYDDWDNADELLITYSIDGGSYQNLMWVQNAGGTFNQAASLDTDFDGDGDCGAGTLGALTTGNDGCNVTSNLFSTFSSSTIALSSNTTLDIRLQFNGLDAEDEGIYLDNIVITESSSCLAPTTQATNTTFSSITETTANVSWTNGNGTNRAVFIKQTSTTSPVPVDNTFYLANTTLSSGTQIGSTGWYCIYNGTGTSATVDGLTASTAYRVMVVEYNCTIGSQKYLTSTATNNPNNFTTAATTSPTITVSTASLIGYGNQCINTNSSSQSYTVSGINLTTDIVITAPTGYEIKTGAGTYASSITLLQTGGTVSNTSIDVRFSPTLVGAHNGNISHTSTLATTQNIAVTGTGINTPGSVTTTVASSITTTTASSGGNGTMGCSNIATRGIVFNTSPTPTINPTSDGSGIGSYASSLTGLTSNTIYYYRSYITDATGTIYGNELSFTTLKDEPTNHPTAFACGTTTTSTIPLTWTDATGTTTPDGYLIKWSIISFASITDPADGTPEADGSTTYNANQGDEAYTATGLTTNAIYYFKIYPYSNSGTSIDYKTSVPIAQTSCATLNGPCIDEDFASFTDWTDNGSATDNVASHADPSGSGIPCRAMGSGDNMISPAINNPNLLEFYQDASGGGNGNTATVEYRIGAGAWTACHSFVVTSTGATESVDLTNISGVNLAVQSNVSFRFNSTFSTWYLDDVVVTCGTPETEIFVTGNGSEIINGDEIPAISDDTDFGNIAVVGGSASHTFTIENTGGLDLLLSGSPIIDLAVGGDFSVSVQPSDDTLSNAETTTFVITFDPSSTGLIKDTVSITSNDTDEDPYTFVIQGFGTNSNSSDIITDAFFPYSSGVNINIPYINYQNVGPFTNTTGSVGVYRFIIRDGGASNDADALGTELTGITFSLGTTHINYIRNAALFDGNAMRTNTPTINTIAGTISFAGLSGANFTAVDDGTRTLTLRVSFSTTVTDNEQIQFTITSASTNPTGSAFAGGNAGGAVSSTTGDRNRIEVVATALDFTQQPNDAAVNTSMTPAVTVSGIDVYTNTDLDWTDNVDLSSSGTMTGDPITVAAVNGVAAFSGIVHTVAANGLTLTASHSSFANDVSTAFNITTIVFNNGDYRTTGSGNWLNNSSSPAIWERLVAGSWTISNSPNYNTSNTVYIRDTHTITSGGSWGNSVDLVIQDGGRFNANHPGTTNSVYVYDGGTFAINSSMTNNNNFEFEDNSTLIINRRYGSGTENTPSWWDGTENFHPNSTIIFNDYDCSDDYLIPDNISIDANSYSGYSAVFGNIIIDYGSNLGASDDWKLLDSDVNINMAHGDLIFRSNDENGATMRLATTGTVTSGIGGDFIVEDGYNNVASINLKTSGNLTFTIEGDMQLDAATTRVVAGAIGSATVNIEGDLNITPSAVLNFNSTVSTTPVAIINLKGDVTVAGSGLLTNNNSSNHGALNFVGSGDGLTDATTQTIDIASTSSQENRYISFEARAGTYVKQINRDFELGTNSSLTVQIDAVYDFGFNGTTPLNLTISGTQTGTVFSSQQGSTLKITNPDGIWGGGAQPITQGNVQTVKSNRSFNQVATFHYIGKANQVTGNAITTGSSGKIIVCELVDNNTQLSFTNSTGITSATTISTTGGKLDIRIGQAIESTTAYITGTDGTLYMEAGTLYQIAKGNTTSALSNADPIPRLVGATFPYILNGGTVELAGNTAGNYFQTLRGSQLRPNYINVKFNGSNTLATNYKNLTSTTVVENELTVTGSAVVDCINSAGLPTSFIGDGALVMDNGTLRIKKLNTPNPELTGIDADYDITGGTVEFYGTRDTTKQLIRGKDERTTPRTIAYYNIELNSELPNRENDGYNIGLAAGIEIEGIMNINKPTVFQTDRYDHIDGGGAFFVRDSATYKYGDDFGITLGTATDTSAGAIRVTTNRTIAHFPSTASYGFVGASDMVTGNGLPAQAVGIYLDKSQSHSKVTITNPLTITDTLDMDRGNIITETKLLQLGTGATNELRGTLSYEDTHEPFIIGRLRRWFSTDNNYGNETGLFPLGDTTGAGGLDIYNRFLLLEYSSLKSTGGTITTKFINIGMGYQGIPINGIDAVGGCPTFDVISTEDQGYWRVIDGGGLAGGSYDISCTGEGFNNVVDPCEITLLKRVDFGDWLEDGFHQLTTNGSSKPTAKRTGVTGFSNFGFGGGITNLLPVELVSFTATNQNNNSLLNWITSSEVNNDYFEVEHSLDAISFEKVGDEDGNGTTSETRLYEHIHYSPPAGVNYYRLKQVDFDGRFEYSNILSVLIKNEDNNTMQVVNTIPKNELVLQFQSTSAKKGNLVIYASNGQIIDSQELNINAGISRATFDVSRLPSALYIVQWYNGDEIIEEKFIKSH